MTQNEQILVSVSMITYNHAEFIAEAIESIVAQKTNFEFELIIGEDCSTDTTRDICLQYKAKYPHIIRLLLPEKNIGMMPNMIETIEVGRGKYTALCEGDDYWTDEYKLQKQVDFMEQNPTYSMCAHASQILKNNEFTNCSINESTLSTDDLLKQNWGIMTASIVFRKENLIIPEWYSKIKNGDFGLQLLVSLNGKIGYLKDSMSVYRIHPGGISNTLRPFEQAAWLTYLLYEFNRTTHKKFLKQIKQRIKKMYNVQLGFAKEYHLRRAWVKLKFFQFLSPLFPFLIKDYRS